MRVERLLIGFLLAGVACVASAGTGAAGGGAAASHAAAPAATAARPASPPPRRLREGASRSGYANPFVQLCAGAGVRVPTDDAGAGCSELFTIRERAAKLRAGDGGTLSAEHAAELQADIDRVVAGAR
jgi:hypothetical protein